MARARAEQKHAHVKRMIECHKAETKLCCEFSNPHQTSSANEDILGERVGKIVGRNYMFHLIVEEASDLLHTLGRIIVQSAIDEGSSILSYEETVLFVKSY
ncbi:hypothetical protein CDL15_Pgr010468 [Punica granatum]|uniref:Uncharacterized protein n=1 Tax=Punica granatum TaxID=22663 RepID=A0A218XY19_PUNGR|nr:hypothetical protein CDL15_Pgr010468 [Punica granatum]